MYTHEHSKEEIELATKDMLNSANFSIFMKSFLYSDTMEIWDDSIEAVENKRNAKKFIIAYINDLEDEVNGR